MLKTILFFALIQCSIRDVENVRLRLSSNEILLNKKSIEKSGLGFFRIENDNWLFEEQGTSKTVSGVFSQKRIKRDEQKSSDLSNNQLNNSVKKSQSEIKSESTPQDEVVPSNNEKHEKENSKSSVEKTTDEKKINTRKKNEEIEEKNFTISTAALFRGFYVFLGLSAAVLIYIGFKTIRVTKSNSNNTTVRKYGVTAKRGDLEMLPLPLAEEEDDETLFDVGTISHSNTS